MRPDLLLRRLWYLLNRRRLERELEREMSSHRAMMTEPHRFGSTMRLREESSDVWGWTWLDDVGRDLRYGARQLRAAPRFTVAAMSILTLGAGVGCQFFTERTRHGSTCSRSSADAPDLDHPGGLRSVRGVRVRPAA
jgi:hypothetical protein